MSRVLILRYLIEEYYGNDFHALAKATGYTSQQIRSWMEGDIQPQKSTIETVAMCALAPEFRVIAEFVRFSPDASVGIRHQLQEALQEHGQLSGIYAFYDSMANLIYVGKANTLLDQMYQSMRQPIAVEFPAGVKKLPEIRADVVRYFSAYEVAGLKSAGYPKHVESLILRISKPPLNKNIGGLDPRG